MCGLQVIEINILTKKFDLEAAIWYYKKRYRTKLY